MSRCSRLYTEACRTIINLRLRPESDNPRWSFRYGSFLGQSSSLKDVKEPVSVCVAAATLTAELCVRAAEQSCSLIAANRGYHQSVCRHRGPSVSVMEPQQNARPLQTTGLLLCYSCRARSEAPVWFYVVATHKKKKKSSRSGHLRIKPMSALPLTSSRNTV